MSDDLQRRMEAGLERRGMDLDSEEDSRQCSCEELTEHLFEFLDRQVSDGEFKRLAAHIAHCPECQDRASAEEHVRVLLKRSCAEVAPATLRVRISHQIEAFRTTLGGIA
ncbi:mycothiol system anti-sigma-R factor [Neoactinobaculum massilliense]|uniref:mycothiol system anti-sigma-R factor n=1 Tax=Neoactinobaculum massilliense TaxID=2364794 RepID=UPI000F53CF58|nr:mycothiol system anti-sigma-R factor [Neoactinobaculum massilliense]